MKKYQKVLVLLTLVSFIFVIYNILRPNGTHEYYIPIGDSLAEGMNSYGEIGYGYTDYISEYLQNHERLNFYTKGFTKSGYETKHVITDIENNREIEVDGKILNIKKALRESTLVTISIGANDFLHQIELANLAKELSNMVSVKKQIDTIGKNVEEVVALIKQYAKGQIILIGYYNPLPRLSIIKSQIDEIVEYANNIYKEIADDYDIIYVDIFDLFDNNTNYLPNSFDIHPNTKGYEAISKRTIKYIK